MVGFGGCKSVSDMLQETRDHYIPGTQPEEHDRVDLVDHWDEKDRQHHEEDDVAKYKVTGEVAKLGDLAEELTARL